MTRFTKRRLSVVARNLPQLIFSALAVAGLLFMFIKAQPTDPAAHNALTSDLRELQVRDTELGEAVLQHHYRMQHNYDGVIFVMQRMQALGVELVAQQQSGSLPDTPEFSLELNATQQRIAQKAVALEEFKSNNAVLKNSFVYLPRTVNVVLTQIPLSSTGWHESFEFLLRDALMLAVDQSDRAHENLKQTIILIDGIISALPGHVKESAELASRHAKLILEHDKPKAELLAELSSAGKNKVGAGLEQLYLNYYQAQQRSASSYRLLLFLAAMLMLGYAVYAYFRMGVEEQQLRIAATAFETQEGILITGLNHRIIRVNRAFTKLTGYAAEEAIGQTPDLLKSGVHDEEFYPSMWATIAKEKYWQGEVISRRKNGKIYPIWLTTTAVTDVRGRVTHYVSVFDDITTRKEAEEQIHQLAFYDPLTNLPNRRLLVDRLRHTMASGTRNAEHGALLFVDLDNFKTLNDTKGHDVGDLLLVETARRLQECVRGGDSIARLGGDEFIILLVGLGTTARQAAAQARAAGEKIREALSQPYLLRNFEHRSSCSIGISLFRANEISVDDLLKRADTAMYEAKAAGRNVLRFFDPAMQAALESRAMLEADLYDAVAQKQFCLFYEIQVDVAKRPIGIEALLRWVHPERGLVLPSDFIPLAEETGLILPIGLWVLEAACAQIKTWEAHPLVSRLPLAINVSARQFHQPNFVAQVREALTRNDIKPNFLKIELTESVVLDGIDEAVVKMNDLKKIGVRFSVDDFGTGYSSLAYLTQLPIDQLKIDQSFVRNIGSKPNDAVIVQTIVGMGHNLGMEVIAEGVETEVQRAFLERAGCVAYQGYLFGRPMPLQKFEHELLIGGYAQARVTS